jgi:DNA replication and repair protein RecF
VGLSTFRATDFRCLETVVLEAHPNLNLIVGANAAGKTSLLEAIYFLGRGRSFRGAGNRELVRRGAETFTLFGKATETDTEYRLGAQTGVGQRILRINDETAKPSEMAELLPVQAIDPDIHELIQGSPENRRRFLDWGVFHVEHSFLENWQRYQKTLRQRNAALKQGQSRENVTLWDAELIQSGERVNQYRAEFVSQFMSVISSKIADHLPFDVKCSYISGNDDKIGLAQSLEEKWDRDAALQSTQVGPHRADLRIEVSGRAVRHKLSRGQQKLLGAALVIAQTYFVVESRQREVVLLVDDPAAELDRHYRQRLFDLLKKVPAQLFLTALEQDDLPWQQDGLLLSVDAGKVSPLL